MGLDCYPIPLPQIKLVCGPSRLKFRDLPFLRTFISVTNLQSVISPKEFPLVDNRLVLKLYQLFTFECLNSDLSDRVSTALHVLTSHFLSSPRSN